MTSHHITSHHITSNHTEMTCTFHQYILHAVDFVDMTTNAIITELYAAALRSDGGDK